MNLQLNHVVSDITGVTGMRIIRTIIAGERTPDVLPFLERRRQSDANTADGCADAGTDSGHRQGAEGAYGSPRMVRELRDREFRASKERVERLMRENGIRARHKRRFKATTDSKHALPVAPNLLARDFTPASPNQGWTTDMTCIWTDESWIYLPVVLDLFNREVVGWSIKPRMTADIVIVR